MGERFNMNTKTIIFYVVLFLFILGFSTTATNYDLDLWARLIAGMGFVQTGHVLKHDFLSYTPTHAWYDHEWGSGVIFYLAHKIFGVAGFLFLQAILVFLIFFTVSKVIKLRGTTSTTPYNFLFYYFAFMAFSYTADMPVRCQLFSFLFFTVYLYILESARSSKPIYLSPEFLWLAGSPRTSPSPARGEGANALIGASKSPNSKLLWLLPPIMLVWNNLHGGCVIGIGLIVLYIVGEILNRKPFKNYIFALLGTLVVLPINPWGFDYLEFLFRANTMNRSMIMEWQGLFSKMPVIQEITFKYKLFASVLLYIEADFIIKNVLAKNYKFDATKFLVVLTTLFFAIRYVKLIPFSVIAMSCFLYDDFYTIFNTLTKNLFNKIAIAKDSIIYVLIAIFAVSSIYTNSFGPYLDCCRFPLRLVEFIKINNIKGNILQNFSNGSFVSYKLYPNNKIFIDGRYEEVYNPELLEVLNDFYTSDKDKLLKNYPPDIIFLSKKQPIFEQIEKDKNWKIIFDDTANVVFVKSNKAKKSYKQPPDDLKYYRKTLFDTSIDFTDRK